MRSISAAGCGEQLLAQHVIDGRNFEPAAHFAADRDRVNGKAVQEIGGAIEWIDDPAGFVVAAGAAFFRQDRVVRIMVTDYVDDLSFRRAVNLGDVVVACLGVDFDAFELRDAARDHFAAPACCAYRDIQQWVHSQLE